MKFTVFSVCLFVLFVPGHSRKDRVKLKDVEVLTCQKGKFSTGRRTNPIPQVACIGGTGKCAYVPNQVQCYNRGSDGLDINWECKADLRNKYVFRDVEVICEGYDYPEDEYVLIGSCGVEFRLDLLDPDAEDDIYSRQYRREAKMNEYSKRVQTKGDAGVSIGFIMFAIVSVVLLVAYCRPSSGHDRGSNQAHATPSAPPPPPGFYYDNDQNQYKGQEHSGHEQSRRSGQNQAGNGSFWSNVMSAGAGYMFGRWSNNPGPQPSTRYSSGRTSSRERSSTPSSAGTSSRQASGFATTRRR